MSSVVTELEAALQAMQNTKPPGVSGTKISFITELSVNNVQSESVIIQKLYTHFKKCPGTHKLGPLYVVDSIARKYLDQAKKNHQEVSSAAPDGTFAAGVFRITNLLPPLMNDILQHSPPEENKDKIEKLYAIWERSSTFPPEVLADVKRKMNASPMFQPTHNHNQSSTPPGSPPRPQIKADARYQERPQPQTASTTTNVASMLQAIAQMAKQNQNPFAAPEPTPPAPAPVTQYNIGSSQSNGHTPILSPPTAASHPVASLPYTSTPPNVNGHPSFQNQMAGAYQQMYGQNQPPQQAGYPNQPQQQAAYPQNQPQQQTGYPQGQPQQTGYPQNQPQQQQQAAFPFNLLQPQQPQIGMEQQFALLQLLLQQPGLQQNAVQLAPALQALLGGAVGGQGFQMPNVGDPLQQQQQQFWGQSMGMQQPAALPQDEAPRPPDAFNNEQRSRERGYSPPPLSPPRYRTARRGRSRSRSPTRFPGREEPRSPPSFRRRSPVYGEYEGNNIDPGRGMGGMGERGARGGRNRGRKGTSPRRKDRSPQGRAGGSQAGGSQSSPPPRELPKVVRNVQFVDDIPQHCVRVLSRTLFVGGVTIGDDELRLLFENYGLVQSCIVNQDKRHAFIKMLTREDAVKAKAGMETYRTEHMTLRTRWGVGFGPRDCSDYQTGVSVIPIDRLTEADQRWMVSAEYGGTGGQPLQGGMCVEEPDIEIGQGVSSKAISKRFPTDSGGNKGPRSTHDPHAGGGGGGGGGGPTHRGNKRKDDHHKGGQDPGQRGAQGAPGGRDNAGVAPPTPGFGAGFPFSIPMFQQQQPYPGFQQQGGAQPPSGR